MKAVVATIGVVILFLLGAAMQGVHLYLFLNLPVFVMIFGPLCVTLFYSQGFTGSGRLMSRLFASKATEADVAAIKNLVSLGLLLGGMGTVIGVMVTIGKLDQGTEVIGHAFGSAFVAMLFGAIPSVLLVPLAKMNVGASGASLLKVAAGFCGFVFTGSLGLFAFAMWVVGSSA